MLLISVTQFDSIKNATQHWLNTITYATMILWQQNNNATYRFLDITSTYDVYNIVFIAQKLWNLTASDRKKYSDVNYDYNNLEKVGYNHDFCLNIANNSTNVEVSVDFDDIIKQKLSLLASERAKNLKNPYYSPDIPLNFIIAAANVYSTIISNSELGILSTTYFKNQKFEHLEHLPEITTCSLDFIHNSVDNMPLTLTDFRIMEHYKTKISHDNTDLYNYSINSIMLSDYVYYQLIKETLKIDYITSDYGSHHYREQLSDSQFNEMFQDPLGMSKLALYGLIYSAITILTDYNKSCYEQALKVYNIIDQHYTSFNSRRTFYAHLLEFVSRKCCLANQISYDYSSFDSKKFIQIIQTPTIDNNYVNCVPLDKQHYNIRPTSNQYAIWTNIRHVAKILAPDFMEQLFNMPYNMWETLLNSDYDMLDATLSKLELALYNMVSFSVYLQPFPNTIGWGVENGCIKLNTLKTIVNPIFDAISVNIAYRTHISTRLNLKISDYYNLFTSDTPEKKKNRVKLVKQINQVLKWLEKVLASYDKNRNEKIITERIVVR